MVNIHIICAQSPELVMTRYDRDGNNEPCLKNGHKAHWAVFTGGLSLLRS